MVPTSQGSSPQLDTSIVTQTVNPQIRTISKFLGRSVVLYAVLFHIFHLRTEGDTFFFTSGNSLPLFLPVIHYFVLVPSPHTPTHQTHHKHTPPTHTTHPLHIHPHTTHTYTHMHSVCTHTTYTPTHTKHHTHHTHHIPTHHTHKPISPRRKNIRLSSFGHLSYRFLLSTRYKRPPSFTSSFVCRKGWFIGVQIPEDLKRKREKKGGSTRPVESH